MICLDTNYLVRALIPNTREAVSVTEWLVAGESLLASTVVWYEFCCGPITAEEIDLANALLTGGRLAFHEDEAIEAARLFNGVGRSRRLRVDAMIAATAILAGAPLATRNVDDFAVFVPYGLALA